MSAAIDPVAPTERVLSTLAEHGCNPRRSGPGWSARCPAHEDRSPSLSVTESETGNALVHCHAGCTTPDVARAIGLHLVDLFPPRPPKVAHIGPAGRIKATYNYYDEDGALAYRVVRYDPKTFRQQRYEEGRWHNGRGTVPRYLYNLPQLLAAKRAGRPIWVVEGEKDAENAQWLVDGIVATTAPEGAGKWEDSFTDALTGAAEVVVVADKDAPGYRHAQGVAQALRGKVGHLTVVEAVTGKDLTDHYNAGRGADEFVVLWNSSAPTTWLDSDATPGGELDEVFSNHNLIKWDDFWADDTTAEDWFAYPFLPAGRGVAIYAPAKTGKSLVMLHVAAALAAGRPCLGQPPQEPRHVLYLDYEMTKADVRERLEDMGYGPEVDMSHFHYDVMPATLPLDTKAGGDDVVALAKSLDVQAVVVDTFSRVISREENDNKAAQEFYSHVGRPLKAAGIGVYRLDHAGKDLERGQRGGSAKNDDVDVVWQLLAGEGGLRLKRTYSRVSWVPESIELVRSDDPLGFVYEEKAAHYQPGTKEAAAILDRLQLPLDVGRRKAREALKTVGETMGTGLLADAIRWRKASQPAFGGPLPNVSTDFLDTSKADYVDTSGGHTWTTPSEQGGHVDGHTWTHETANPVRESISIDGHTAEGPPRTPPEDPPDDEELSLL
jgi:KaiC/GvpD/RAD55 family RecA-like ATPase/5S rRNA maturation endonuclease (ribonuclease M5)